jgi:hypothetical protein
MPERTERQVRLWLEIAVLVLGALNAWYTARVDTAVAQMEVRIERRMSDLAIALGRRTVPTSTRDHMLAEIVR